ncbi:MAG: cation:proton antiporter [Candidatus Cloacimonetes bacterium HGW-Cloacimonetes-1]|jgi:multicomponent Na+:H+ antiporter subunit F|nr:MAG: cation:proton antiporter [Candidatus Cloacimonetes bacterium HGW-Cloacimonetes-1]
MAYYIAMLALAIAFVRFLMGPSSVDRVLALDTMTICSIALIIFIAMYAGRIIYIDVALVYALLSFLGVIAVARYLEGGL